MRRARCVPPPGAHLELPRERADGWMELEMGEFFNGGADDDGDVSSASRRKEVATGRRALLCMALKLERRNRAES
jgi:hypothetical protein